MARAELARASALLARICPPIAAEIGGYVHPDLDAWRAGNIVALVDRACAMIEATPGGDACRAHPRLVAEIIDHGWWVADEEARGLWAGLLASACTPDGDDDSNVMFTGMLAQMTAAECRLFTHLCKMAESSAPNGGWFGPPRVNVSEECLLAIAGTRDDHRVACELEHLASLGLIKGGLEPGEAGVCVSISLLGLAMYSRGRGYRETRGCLERREAVV